MNTHRRLPLALSVHHAAVNAPALARLTALARESSDRLKSIEPLLPPALHGAIKAGPLDDKSWCLLVSGNAAAAKTRQLLPLIQARLAREGWKVTPIRLKILLPAK